jgi:hypothetical protein
MSEIGVVEALNSLLDNPVCLIEGSIIIDWADERPQPTQLEIDTEITRLQTEYDSNLFQRQRAQEYPPIVDQLDDIFHNGIDGWKASIQVVKDKYPKGSN